MICPKDQVGKIKLRLSVSIPEVFLLPYASTVQKNGNPKGGGRDDQGRLLGWVKYVQRKVELT